MVATQAQRYDVGLLLDTPVDGIGNLLIVPCAFLADCLGDQQAHSGGIAMQPVPSHDDAGHRGAVSFVVVWMLDAVDGIQPPGQLELLEVRMLQIDARIHDAQHHSTSVTLDSVETRQVAILFLPGQQRRGRASYVDALDSGPYPQHHDSDTEQHDEASGNADDHTQCVPALSLLVSAVEARDWHSLVLFVLECIRHVSDIVIGSPPAALRHPPHPHATSETRDPSMLVTRGQVSHRSPCL